MVYTYAISALIQPKAMLTEDGENWEGAIEFDLEKHVPFGDICAAVHGLVAGQSIHLPNSYGVEKIRMGVASRHLVAIFESSRKLSSAELETLREDWGMQLAIGWGKEFGRDAVHKVELTDGPYKFVRVHAEFDFMRASPAVPLRAGTDVPMAFMATGRVRTPGNSAIEKRAQPAAAPESSQAAPAKMVRP